jgi:catechol 2,3-dioxygenase-like lactoylglutathione lyase family enzyme
MKRFHVHVAVDDIDANVRFYSTMFGTSPSVLKDDYAKWMLDDPCVNFAISRRGIKSGVDHLGVQVDSEEQLVKLRGQVERAQIAAFDQSNATCCYARSDKYWVTDPQGIAWETFHTLESVPVYGEDSRAPAATGEKAACCAPAPSAQPQLEKSGACCG